MDIAESIRKKEYHLQLCKNLRNECLDNGLIQLAKETEEQIKDLEKSIEHDRKIQLEEAKTSGRKEWYHDLWKYVLVFIGGAVFIEIVKFALSKL